ncbi:MAG: hydrogenase maturation protease [Planctomycetota bacterium]|jgi:hydrogenase maturation protease
MTHDAKEPRSSARVLFGVGNIHRHDDGVGIVLARRIAEMGDHGVRVVEATGEGATLMADWEDVDHVVLVDAVRSGASPGKIHRLDAKNEKIPSDFFHYSTHAFSVAEAVEMARALDSLPPRLAIFGIEGEDFSAGIGLTSAVQGAAEGIIDVILAEFGVSVHQPKGDS